MVTVILLKAIQSDTGIIQATDINEEIVMENRPSPDISLIAPCGINCGLCLEYLRDKNRCLGCNADDANKPVYCVKCRIKNCEKLQETQSKFCYECNAFPCSRIKQLDKRYRTKYAVNVIGNLEQIRNFGMDEFIKSENTKWTCKTCGSTICMHRGFCLKCKGKKGTAAEEHNEH